MNDANVLISEKSKVILDNNNILPLTHELFEDGALVFRNMNSKPEGPFYTWNKSHQIIYSKYIIYNS